ncbi:hypothetical protein GPDM_11165 [Planococcus donghaensis MPA1U2]|uniref:Uncharacterized protein n=1 Tax=Planococcus donghaensis MPA1U2 TaxID=933115 RepID=E7RIC3_9BACL|nr:hypothetical protein GPDM_11165 [Planococcus donghaensis MPA1U2]
MESAVAGTVVVIHNYIFSIDFVYSLKPGQSRVF